VNPQAASVPPEIALTCASVAPPVEYVAPTARNDQRLAGMLPATGTSSP